MLRCRSGSRDTRQIQRPLPSNSWSCEGLEQRRYFAIESRYHDERRNVLPERKSSHELHSEGSVPGRWSVDQLRIRGRASPRAVSRSHTRVSIQVQVAKHSRYTLIVRWQMIGRRRLQAFGTRNIARRKNSRDEFVRFVKVIWAE